MSSSDLRACDWFSSSSLVLLGVLNLFAFNCMQAPGEPPLLQPLSPLKIRPKSDEVALGKMLFFDPRLSGDATISCATCHDPTNAFTDGMELSNGYPGTKYFRNTPTLINAASSRVLYWDARMSGDDLPSLVRDHISEAHFMQADGRLVIERLRQVPSYESRFQTVFGGEPSYGMILNAVSAFVRSLKSIDVPFDNYLNGDRTAMSPTAIRGLRLFQTKANCISCHNGPRLSDDKLHLTAVPENEKIFSDPERHITFRRFMRTIGVGKCASLRSDIGYACVTKNEGDNGRFRTPSLREVARTAPYMHNGKLKTLEEVVQFYNAGGSAKSNRANELQPLRLTSIEQAELIEFLKQLSGKPLGITPMQPPAYQLRSLGESSS